MYATLTLSYNSVTMTAMATEAQWTIDELTQLVGEALAVNYAGQANGRIREVPDRRTIRWYTTIGLLDRPAAMRGRTALYGRRHLLQLVAVKRLQADGRTIAEVQTALLGAEDTTLDQLAHLPDPPAEAKPAARPASAPASAAAPTPASPPTAAPARFWAARPATPQLPQPHPSQPQLPQPQLPQPQLPQPHPSRPQPARPTLIPSIRLADGVTLVLDGAPRPLEPADLAAITEAAATLLDLLHDRGLAAPIEGGPA
jgi:DNA-binding transcriptional MerR regulator